MPTLESVALDVSFDEMAISLKELIEMAPDSSGFRRYQTIRVVRNDRDATYTRDMGPVSEYSAYELVIPGGVRVGDKFEMLHTVGELIDIADLLRNQPKEEWDGPSDMLGTYADERENMSLQRNGHSTFGPGGSTVRGHQV